MAGSTPKAGNRGEKRKGASAVGEGNLPGQVRKKKKHLEWEHERPKKTTNQVTGRGISALPADKKRGGLLKT